MIFTGWKKNERKACACKAAKMQEVGEKSRAQSKCYVHDLSMAFKQKESESALLSVLFHRLDYSHIPQARLLTRHR